MTWVENLHSFNENVHLISYQLISDKLVTSCVLEGRPGEVTDGYEESSGDKNNTGSVAQQTKARNRPVTGIL